MIATETGRRRLRLVGSTDTGSTDAGGTDTGGGGATTSAALPARVAAGAPRTSSRGVRALLRFPLFYKILVANAVIVVAVVAVAAAILHPNLTADGGKLLALVAAGLVVSIASNGLIVRLALSPLARLERTAEKVQAGDMSARVEPSELADAEMERLTATFNTMLASGDHYRQRLREVAARALSAQEEERKRIARELHDGTAQTLAALRVRLRIARSLEDGEARNQLLERISGDLGEAAEELRRIAQGLRPPALDMLGLAPAIESYARGVGETAGVTTALDLQPVEGLLSPDAELALYRIVQEALSNVARHSNAGTVRVRLEREQRSVTARIEDDGRGFGVRAEMTNGGLGLYGMQERAAYVGGSVEIESEPGRGVRVRVTIPVLETAPYA
jgi:two-component system, NarL family, sensor histidine kinase UhpB